MRSIVFFNTKGGTGKTTICFNYGWYLAKYCNKRILFLDFDPQVSLGQALIKETSKYKGLENFIVTSLNDSSVNIRDYIVKIDGNIDFLPSSNNISLLEEFLTDYLLKKAREEDKACQSLERNLLIKNILEKNINTEDYDYILIDSQPNYSLLSTTSLIFAKNIVIVLKPEIFNYLDIKYLKRIINNLEIKYETKLNIAAVLINAYERRKIASESIYSKFRKDYAGEFSIINQKIRYLSQYQLSILLNNQPVFLSFPCSEASLDLLDAFEELDILVNNAMPVNQDDYS